MEDIQFYHSRHSKNRVTIAGHFEGTLLYLSAARCGNKDNFCRKTGRLISEGRLNKQKYLSIIDTSNRNSELNKTTIFVEEASKLAKEVNQNARIFEQINVLAYNS